MDESGQVYRYQAQNVVKQAPRRVVSLVPSATETLFDLGFGDKVVGITDDCLYPAGKVDTKYRLGPVDAINTADVIGLYPDLVITNREENNAATIERLEDAGLVVWKTFPRTVMEAMNLIWDTLHAFMVDDRLLYERVNLINRTIDWVGGVSESKEDQICKVFVGLLPEPLATVGRDTYTHDLLRVSGGTNVFGDLFLQPTSSDPAEDMNRYPLVTMEAVEVRQPDVILLAGYPLGFGEDDLDRFAKLKVPAAETGQIYLLDGTLLTYHGSRLAKALNEISALMCAVGGDDDGE